MEIVAAAVGSGKATSRSPTLASSAEVGQRVGDEMHHFAFALDLALHRKHAGAEDDAAMLLENLRPYDQVGNPGLVLQRDEHHPLGTSRPLSHQHDTRGFQPTFVARAHGLGAGDDPASREIGTQEGNGMASQG